MEQGEVVVLDRRFRKYVVPIAKVERLFTGALWAEGPVYFADLRCLIFSDIPNSRMLKWDEQTGDVAVFRADSNYSNGNTRDREGRLVSCEHGGRRVTRTEHDGSVSVLVDKFEGKRLNSPNDVVVKSDGTIWFTDPTYGILTDYEGFKGESEIGACNVYRYDPARDDLSVVVDDFVKPNGLVFSAAEDRLYIADSGFSHDDGAPHHVRRFDVTDDGRLTGGEVFAEISPGIPDGLRIDSDGNLWVAAADGAQCYTDDGTLIGKVTVPEAVANITFGGPRRNRLFMTATSSLYAVYLGVSGIQRP